MKEKKTHGIQLLIQAVVTGPDGKVISDTGERPARSFVIQFLEFIRTLFDATYGTISFTATDGTEDRLYESLSNLQYQFNIDAGVGASSHGLVVGTSDAAETNTDYRLGARIGHGVGVGNISYGAVVITAAAVVGPNVDLVVKRAFTNLTGSAIGVKEAGIYTKFNVSTYWYHCIARDVFPGTVNVPDHCSLTVYYTIRTTV